MFPVLLATLVATPNMNAMRVVHSQVRHPTARPTSAMMMLVRKCLRAIWSRTIAQMPRQINNVQQHATTDIRANHRRTSARLLVSSELPWNATLIHATRLMMLQMVSRVPVQQPWNLGVNVRLSATKVIIAKASHIVWQAPCSLSRNVSPHRVMPASLRSTEPQAIAVLSWHRGRHASRTARRATPSAALRDASKVHLTLRLARQTSSVISYTRKRAKILSDTGLMSRSTWTIQVAKLSATSSIRSPMSRYSVVSWRPCLEKRVRQLGNGVLLTRLHA